MKGFETRDRFERIAYDFSDNQGLIHAIKEGCWDDILAAIRERTPEEQKEIITRYFDNLPDAELVADAFSMYEGIDEGVGKIAMCLVSEFSRDPESIVYIARNLLQEDAPNTLRLYQGIQGVDDIGYTIGSSVTRMEDPEEVGIMARCLSQEYVVEVVRNLQGQQIRTEEKSKRAYTAAEIIGATANWTKDPEAVRSVSGALIAYKNHRSAWYLCSDIWSAWQKGPEAVIDVCNDYMQRLEPALQNF